jgi:hypothetical protein
VFEHDLFRKPVSTPDQVGGRLFRDHALKLIFHLKSTQLIFFKKSKPARRRSRRNDAA